MPSELNSAPVCRAGRSLAGKREPFSQVTIGPKNLGRSEDSSQKSKLDVAIVCTVRPNIFAITLNSFKHQMLDQFDVRVVLNVDPIGDCRYSQKDIVRICEQYFGNVVSNTPQTPSFSAAVKWCWSQIKTDFFFHLEDDWCLKSRVDPSMILQPFDASDVVSVRLNVTKNSKFKIDRDGVVHSNGLSLNPSMMRTSYVMELLQRFDVEADPEKQYSRNNVTPSFPRPKFLIYGKSADRSMVIDTGKKWRRSVGFAKSGTPRGGMVWAKKGESAWQIFLRFKYYLFLVYWSKLYCKNLTIARDEMRQSVQRR